MLICCIGTPKLRHTIGHCTSLIGVFKSAGIIREFEASITASSASVATAAKASVRNSSDVQLHITISASPVIMHGEALQHITSQIIFHDPTHLDPHSGCASH
jgi:hypothetical protein